MLTVKNDLMNCDAKSMHKTLRDIKTEIIRFAKFEEKLKRKRSGWKYEWLGGQLWWNQLYNIIREKRKHIKIH